MTGIWKFANKDYKINYKHAQRFKENMNIMKDKWKMRITRGLPYWLRL